MVVLIIGGAFVFNYIVVSEQIPNLLAAWLGGLNLPPLLFLLLVNGLFLLFGCFLDATVMLLVLGPLPIPTLKALGIDLVHFGVVIVVNIMIGLIRPPYGVLLFVLNGLTGISPREMIAEIWPFLFVLIAAPLVMVLLPETVLWLPREFGYK
jgi:TRAP-type C4-dicarboxylate transport system permease large subunit